MTENKLIEEFPPFPALDFAREARLLKVVDGDTLDVEIDLGWSTKLKERVRLEFVETPEMKLEELEAGKWVKAKVEEYLPEGTLLRVISVAYQRTGKIRGKFGRTLAHIYHAEEKWCLNRRLLEECLAWRTDEHGKILGRRELFLLTGLPKQIRGA